MEFVRLAGDWVAGVSAHEAAPFLDENLSIMTRLHSSEAPGSKGSGEEGNSSIIRPPLPDGALAEGSRGSCGTCKLENQAHQKLVKSERLVAHRNFGIGRPGMPESTFC